MQRIDDILSRARDLFAGIILHVSGFMREGSTERSSHSTRLPQLEASHPSFDMCLADEARKTDSPFILSAGMSKCYLHHRCSNASRTLLSTCDGKGCCSARWTLQGRGSRLADSSGTYQASGLYGCTLNSNIHCFPCLWNKLHQVRHDRRVPLPSLQSVAISLCTTRETSWWST